MSSSQSENYITEDHLLQTCYAMLALGSVFVLARFVTTQLVRPTRFLVQDLWVYFAYALFVAMTVLYIFVIPTLYRITAVSEGQSPPYATILEDSNFLIRVFFTTSMLFWSVLWAIKLSFLALYKKLLDGLHDVYIKLWWAVVVFCFLSYVGAVVSHLTSCSSMHAWFTPPLCTTPRDARAQIASLYYTYAVDVISDLFIMALPIRLIWNLQMPRTQKYGVVGLFCIGLVLIIAATLRVAQVGGKARSSSTPSSSWLALWGVIECTIAVCCPTFVTLIRNHTTPALSYNTQGFVRQKEDGNSTSNDVKLGSMLTGSSANSSNKSTVSKERGWEEVDGSQFESVSGPRNRDVVEELEEETPQGRKKIKVRRGAR